MAKLIFHGLLWISALKPFTCVKENSDKVVLLICCLFCIPAIAQNYAQVFGENYRQAKAFVKENYREIDSVCRKYDVPANFLTAIVFPEIIRYDALSDQMETRSLEILYVNWGKEYADFSIGRFQMKPSFVEKIEQDAGYLKDTVFLNQSGLKAYKNLPDEKQYRESRIARMEQLGWQLDYLIAFYKICEKKFGKLSFKNNSEKLHFYATAYNSGYWKSFDTLKNYQKRKFFTTEKIFNRQVCNYGSVAVYVFEKETF